MEKGLWMHDSPLLYIDYNLDWEREHPVSREFDHFRKLKLFLTEFSCIWKKKNLDENRKMIL